MKKQNWYCFVAGHSGGHIVPCLTLAQETIMRDPSASILFFTTTADLDALITQHYAPPFRIIRLPAFSFTHQNPLALLKDFSAFIFALASALYHLIQYRPQSVTSTGGICAIPITFAARCLRIPVDLYELNVLPGKTIYFLAPFARTLYCCFARTIDFLSSYPCKKAEYPIRFTQNAKKTLRPAGKKTVLILGGSQGSLFINNAIRTWLENEPLKAQLHIIHQTGSRDTTNWHLWYTQHDISAKVFDFSQTLHEYYAITDLVICRSGAGSLFETLYYRTPCITIPLESPTNSHQLHNAFTMATHYPDQFTVCTQSALTHNRLLLQQEIQRIVCLHTAKTTPTHFAPQEQLPS